MLSREKHGSQCQLRCWRRVREVIVSWNRRRHESSQKVNSVSLNQGSLGQGRHRPDVAVMNRPGSVGMCSLQGRSKASLSVRTPRSTLRDAFQLDGLGDRAPGDARGQVWLPAPALACRYIRRLLRDWGEVLFGGRGLGLRLSNRFFTTSEGAGRSVRRPEEPGHRAFVWAGVTPGRMKPRGICGERH